MRNKNGKRMPAIHVRRRGSTQNAPPPLPRTVHVSELTSLKMVSGNERRYRCVIASAHDLSVGGCADKADQLIEWVGFGWIHIRKATPEDVRKWPRVVRGHVK